MQCRNFVTLVLVFLSLSSAGQSPFYSQYRKAEMAMNPAFTGMTPGVWQTGGLWQNRNFGPDTSQNTYLIYGSYRFDFRGLSDKGYGLRVAYEDKYSIAIGMMAEVRRSPLYYEQFSSAYGSVSLQLKTGRNGLISMGAQPGVFMQPAYYPVTSVAVALFNDTVYLPGTPQATHFDLNLGVVYGYGRMDCWNADQLYRFQIGIGASHVLEPWMRDSLPRIPGREVRLHASYLWEVNRALGLIPFMVVQYADEKHLQAGATVVYRKHYSFFDRIRGGLYYQTTGHLSPAMGMRFYWGDRTTYGIDVEVSYDFALRDQAPYGWHQRGFEISLKFGPVTRCWSSDPCSGAYQYESY